MHSICRPLHHHRSWAMAGNEGGDEGSVEKWPFWMSNGWIWGTRPACREHKLQSQFIFCYKKAISCYFRDYSQRLCTGLFLFSPLWSITPPPQKQSLTSSVFFLLLLLFFVYFVVTRTVLVLRLKRGDPVSLDVPKKKKGQTIGKVTSIKMSSIESIEFAWETHRAVSCRWISWFLALYYTFLLTPVALKKEPPCCCILMFFCL